MTTQKELPDYVRKITNKMYPQVNKDKPTYQLGKLTLSWDDDTEAWWDEGMHGVRFYTEQALIDAGAVKVEKECQHSWIQEASIKVCYRCGYKPQPKEEWKDPAAKNHCAVCTKKIYSEPCRCICHAQPKESVEREEIEIPKNLWTSDDMHKWMQQATDMLNRHEQLLREGE